MNLPAPKISGLLFVLLLLSGCTTTKRHPLPEELSRSASVVGMPDHIRMWGDESPEYVKGWITADDKELASMFSGVIGQEHHYLALSGGGPLGAFGAGLLTGWTEKGDRPEFTVVTGISAGALTAPFAFLGPAYDPALKEVFTEVSTKDIVRSRGLLRPLWSDAAMSSRPLRSLLEKYLTPEMMAAIAEEHRRGRRLLIGTTNLDAERSVIWNIGAIACEGGDEALKLICDVLLASASVPAAFPPVMIQVEADGERYDEMHVDGGAVSVVFVYPSGLDWSGVGERLKVQGKPSLYVIQNLFVDPRYMPVKPNTIQIGARAMLSMIRNQGIGDIYRVYRLVERDGLDFHLAYIPPEFDLIPNELFDPVFMNELFDLGHSLGATGYPWKTLPPGYE